MKKLENEFAKQLEEFKTDPLRGYENEARKRLYHEYEPLRFQFAIMADRAVNRILSLGKLASQGILGYSGWLSNKESYFMRSTIYTLLVPLAHFRIMQQYDTL